MPNTKKHSSTEQRWLLYPYRLAHHPLCSKFADHVYTIKGKKVCRGCFNFYLGMIVGVALVPVLIFVANFTYLYLFYLLWALFLPTPITLVIHAPRPIKDVARELLGIGVVTTFATVILAFKSFIQKFDYLGLIIAITVVIIYLTSYKILTKIRENHNRAICMSCEQYNLSRCEGLKEYYDRAVGLIALELGDAFSEE